jgi:hypothetical protein
MIATSRIGGTAVLLVALAGCAGDYQQATSAFHQASAQTTQAISDQNDLVARLGLEVRRDLAIENPARLSIPPGQCETASTTGCEIFFRRDRDAEAQPLQPDVLPLQNTLALARAIEAYAASLEAIAATDTASEANTAAVEAASAIESLANTASTVSGRPAPPTEVSFAQPVGAAAGWLLGLYVKEVQLEALRAATSAAEGPDPASGPMAEATSAFEIALAKAEEVTRPVLAQAVTDRQAAFVNNPSPDTFNAYVLSAGTFDQMVKATSSTIPADLRSAHQELHAALQANEVDDLEEFFLLIEKIQTEAAQLQEIINNLLALTRRSEEPAP